MVETSGAKFQSPTGNSSASTVKREESKISHMVLTPAQINDQAVMEETKQAKSSPSKMEMGLTIKRRVGDLVPEDKENDAGSQQ